jgi:hypothetical protein
MQFGSCTGKAHPKPVVEWTPLSIQ